MAYGDDMENDNVCSDCLDKDDEFDGVFGCLDCDLDDLIGDIYEMQSRDDKPDVDGFMDSVAEKLKSFQYALSIAIRIHRVSILGKCS